jgi:hypothetical protein
MKKSGVDHLSLTGKAWTREWQEEAMHGGSNRQHKSCLDGNSGLPRDTYGMSGRAIRSQHGSDLAYSHSKQNQSSWEFASEILLSRIHLW